MVDFGSSPRSGDTPLRVLFVSTYYKPYFGGIERAIEQLARHYQSDGHAVGVMTTRYYFPNTRRPDLPERETIDGGVQIYRLPTWPHFLPPLFTPPMLWIRPRDIAAALDDFQPNIIHWMSDAWFWVNYLCWRYARRHAGLIFTGSFSPLHLGERWLLQPINFLMSRRVHAVTVLSDEERRMVRRLYLVPSDRIRKIPWGVLPAVRDGTPPKGWLPDRLTILCVGRVGKQKGQEWLLDRLLNIRSRVSRPMQLVLVGGEMGGADELRARIAQEGLSDMVLITGVVGDSELSRWYAHADLFTLFSEYEAFGLVYWEAMAYGIPIVTHAIGATAEVASQGAIVVPTYDAPAAEVALLSLLNDSERRAQLGRQGAAYVKQFSWGAVAERFVDEYRMARAGKIPWPPKRLLDAPL